MGVLNATSKKMGFRRLPKDPVQNNSEHDEEKKSEDESDEQIIDTSPENAADAAKLATPKQSAETSAAVVSPGESSAGTSPVRVKTSKFRKKFRFPNVFKSRRSRGGSQEDSEDDEIGPEAGESDDPVMAVFQSRYKNRVRWALEDQPLPGQYTPENVHKDKEQSSGGDKKAESKVKFKVDEQDGQPLESTTISPTDSNSSNNNVSSSGTSPSNIKKFVMGALFGGGNNKTAVSDKEFQNEVAREVQAQKDLVWESNHDTLEGREAVYTSTQKKGLSPKAQEQLVISFTEDPKIRSAVSRLTKKGQRAQAVYHRYEYAVKYFVRALDMLTESKYPDMHPTVRKTLDHLNEAHHKQSSYNNSANIVKIGIKYEDSGELVRALKMYSIAYRIRRDNLSRTHPSLVVLLNMIGSIQIKRGEYEEAMQVYELALKDPGKDMPSIDYAGTPAPTPTNRDDEVPPPPLWEQGAHLTSKENLLARSVTYREMGTIFEKWNKLEEALKMYHQSLDYVAEWKEHAGISSANKGLTLADPKSLEALESPTSPEELEEFMEKVRVSKSYHNEGENDADQTMERGEMEMSMGKDSNKGEDTDNGLTSGSTSYYDSFFPPHLDQVNAQKGRSSASAAAAAMASGDAEGLDRRDDYADIDVALTIHQIAQLFRKQGQFSQALGAYAVALRGMKYSLGNNHPNVAAILGNFGNLQKEMGDLDAAYETYQEVLGIESYRLGLSHPDVAVTLHNIATIDAARGNHQRALSLYRQVMSLQEKLFGKDHISIAVTAACMGDVYEQLGQNKDAFESYEDSLRIKSAFQGPHTLEVARILHKLAKVALKRMDHRLASTYISRAIFAYRLNNIPEEHAWIVDARRDSADIDASLALAKDMTFEC